MKLVIDLTNGKIDAVGDCEMVIEMLLGSERDYLAESYEHVIPDYYFEE
jgi:hypothetical protein